MASVITGSRPRPTSMRTLRSFGATMSRMPLSLPFWPMPHCAAEPVAVVLDRIALEGLDGDDGELIRRLLLERGELGHDGRVVVSAQEAGLIGDAAGENRKRRAGLCRSGYDEANHADEERRDRARRPAQRASAASRRHRWCPLRRSLLLGAEVDLGRLHLLGGDVERRHILGRRVHDGAPDAARERVDLGVIGAHRLDVVDAARWRCGSRCPRSGSAE